MSLNLDGKDNGPETEEHIIFDRSINLLTGKEAVKNLVSIN